MAVVFKRLSAAQENRRCHGNGKSPFVTLVTRETGRAPTKHRYRLFKPQGRVSSVLCKNKKKKQTRAKDQYAKIATSSSFTFSISCVLDLRAILGEG